MNMSVKQARPEFVEKLKKRMADENLGVTELARKVGVSHPRIIEVVTHGKMPSFDTTIALAKWLKQSDVSTLREAGLLPPAPRHFWANSYLNLDSVSYIADIGKKDLHYCQLVHSFLLYKVLGGYVIRYCCIRFT